MPYGLLDKAVGQRSAGVRIQQFSHLGNCQQMASALCCSRRQRLVRSSYRSVADSYRDRSASLPQHLSVPAAAANSCRRLGSPSQWIRAATPTLDRRSRTRWHATSAGPRVAGQAPPHERSPSRCASPSSPSGRTTAHRESAPEFGFNRCGGSSPRLTAAGGKRWVSAARGAIATQDAFACTSDRS